MDSPHANRRWFTPIFATSSALLLVCRVVKGDSVCRGQLIALPSEKLKPEAFLLKPQPDDHAATVWAWLQALQPNVVLALTNTELLKREQKESASAMRLLRMTGPQEIF